MNPNENKNVNENVLLSIDPLQGLGYFKLESTINYILSEIKSRGEVYQHADIAIHENSTCEPIYIVLPKEGLKFRFDSQYQKLEVIEIDWKSNDRTHAFSYKGNVILNSNEKNAISFLNNPTYNYINSKFGPSKMPRLIENNKYLLLSYEGISFLFENSGFFDSEDSIVLGSDASLLKIAIFSENLLLDSVSKDNLQLKNPAPLIKLDLEKGISITQYINGANEGIEDILQTSDLTISFGETLESVLYKLKNPNYVDYKAREEKTSYDSDNGIVDSSFTDERDFFLNYYSYGIDILIKGLTHRVKKIILHCNNPYDVKFGIYNRANFTFELNKHLLKRIETESAHVARNRKMSDDYNNTSGNKIPLEENDVNLSISNHTTDNEINGSSTNVYLIEKTENMQLNSTFTPCTNNSEGLGFNDKYLIKEDYFTSTSTSTPATRITNYSNNCTTSHTPKMRETAGRPTFDREEKSFGSMNESNLSISLNTSDLWLNVVITPKTNFQEVISRLPNNSYVLYHRHESKINSVYKYYAFDGIIFEIVENNSIASVTIFGQGK